jgi:hypothetical protein
MAEDQAELDKEDAQEKADAEWLAKLGNREPPHYPPDGVSNPVWWTPLQAWKKAHPEIIAEEKAERKREQAKRERKRVEELARWKAANPKKIAAIIKAVGIEKLTAEIEIAHVTEAAIMRMIDTSEADCFDEMTAKEIADEIFDDIMSGPRSVADKAKRLKRELKNPAGALERARVAAQRQEMEGDKDDAKANLRGSGDSWSDAKDEWEADWLEGNWTADAEAEFIVSFENQWLKDHGTPFPGLVEAA